MKMFNKIMIMFFGFLPLCTDLYLGKTITLTSIGFVVAACWLIHRIIEVEVAQEIKKSLEAHHVG